jgi:hypothetical protein
MNFLGEFRLDFVASPGHTEPRGLPLKEPFKFSQMSALSAS